MSDPQDDPGRGRNHLTYADAGVSIDAGNELVRRIAPAAARTRRPEMMGGIGGFAGLCALPAGYREPVLVTGTDGVGTKLRLAIEHDRHDAIGQDLVAMCVNDCLVTGAEPLLFLDYYATAALDVDVAARVVTSIANACEACGCGLAGGETAEMPGMYSQGDYDLAGFCVGIVERDGIITGERIAEGDVMIALASSGPHSNGFSLIRRVMELDPQGAEVRLDALMAPTRLYVRSVLALLKSGASVKGMAHVTGGGISENLPRMLTGAAAETLCFDLEPASWRLPEVFTWLQNTGGIETRELLRTFNCGVGYVLCVPPEEADAALEHLIASGETAWRIGVVARADSPQPDPGLRVMADHCELLGLLSE